MVLFIRYWAFLRYSGYFPWGHIYEPSFQKQTWMCWHWCWPSVPSGQNLVMLGSSSPPALSTHSNTYTSVQALKAPCKGFTREKRFTDVLSWICRWSILLFMRDWASKSRARVRVRPLTGGQGLYCNCTVSLLLLYLCLFEPKFDSLNMLKNSAKLANTSDLVKISAT